MTEVSLRGVSKRFGRVPAIQDVDLEIAAGECCCFVGPSGCGKSTLLRLIAGLEEVSAGDILIGGESVVDRPPSARGVAMVFQSYALYPHMTVFQNMAFGLQQERLRRRAIRARVEETARMLRIESLLERLPKQLSGGQRQRVAIGRAIVRKPRLFLFDEPLSNLDAALRQQMRIEIARLHAELAATMIYVTHDQVEAMTLADRLVVMREGRVAQIGAPLDLYHAPANLFVAGFIGAPPMNLLPATLDEIGPSMARLTLPDGTPQTADVDARHLEAGRAVTCGIRPEHIRLLTEPDAGLRGRVVLRERLGDHSLVVLNLLGPDITVTAKVSPGLEPREGHTVGIDLPPSHCHLFGEDGEACRRCFS